MKTLNLKLKKKWFDMIRSGVKKEEYREITPYWAKRLFEYSGAYAGAKVDWEGVCFSIWAGFGLDSVCKLHNIRPKSFDLVKLDNGYRPDSPTFTIEFKGIEVREGKPEWGAEPGKVYFVIKLGEVL